MDLTIRGARTRVVQVPLNIPLGTSVTVIREVPLILLDLETEEGVPGRAYIFAYTRSGATAVVAHLHEAVALVCGMAAAPQAIHDLLVRRFALLGVTGTVRMALSLLDLALWDATGRAAGLPIAQLLGGTCRAISAYDSRGLGPKDAGALAGQAAELAASGCAAVKLRLGYPDLASDLRALEAVQARLPAEIGLMVDYNQALSVAEALSRGRALEGRGLLWLEEPVRHDDLRGQAAITAALNLPLQTGENFNGPEALADALAADACDFVMPDVARIGGATGFMRAAAVAGAQGVAVSSHLMPELSVHLLAASQTAHWVEWVDWADAILVEPLRPLNGSLTPAARPGFGLDWDEGRIARLEQA